MSYNKIEDFQYWVQQTIPQVYDDSLSFYEVLNKLVNQINTIGAVTNEMSDDLDQFFSTEMKQAIIDQLTIWLNDGTLEEVISQGLLTDIDGRLDNLEMDMTNVKQLSYYQNITVKEYFDTTSNTHYTISTVPMTDSKGNRINIRHGYGGDVVNGAVTENARDFSNRHKATLTVNGAIFDTSTFKVQGQLIDNGTVVSDVVTTGTPKYILAWKSSDRSFKWYIPNTSTGQIKADGYDNAMTGFIPLIDNGSRIAQYILDGYAESNNRHERQAIGIHSNGTIYFLSCGGRGIQGDGGMTCDDMIRILLTYGVKTAFNLDGGGSTQTVLRGVNYILPYDGGGLTERVVPHFLYFAPDTTNPTNNQIDIQNAYTDIGKVDEKADDITTQFYTTWNQGYLQVFAPSGYKTQGIEIWEGGTKKTKLLLQEDQIAYWDYINNKTVFKVLSDGTLTTAKGTVGSFFNKAPVPTDCNAITESGQYWSTMSVPNNPNTSNSFIITHVQFDSQNALQTAIQFSSGAEIRKKRRLASGVWEAWS